MASFLPRRLSITSFNTLSLLFCYVLPSFGVEYGVYNSGCKSPVSGIAPNPFPINISKLACTSWMQSGKSPSSINIIACSQTCICFTEYLDSNDCGVTSVASAKTEVKESCVDRCFEDHRRNFLQLTATPTELERCSKQFNSLYACHTTGIIKGLFGTGLTVEQWIGIVGGFLVLLVLLTICLLFLQKRKKLQSVRLDDDDL